MSRPLRQNAWRWAASVVLALGLASAVGSAAQAKPPTSRDRQRIEIVVRSSRTASMFSRLTIDSPTLILRNAQTGSLPEQRADCYTDLEVGIRDADGKETRYRLERSGHLWDEAAGRLLRLSADASKRMLGYAEALRREHYGALMDWSEARLIVKRKSTFTITDLESGLSFRVQRRAGSDHADVQPMTTEDSKTMKEIYRGAWSWDRRAIIVSKDRTRIAASMNGMPHGGDGIPGNGFKGHFCVHFLGSSSHRSDTPDPAHQLMVYQAAGQLRSYFASASPGVMAINFAEAVARKDIEMLQLLWPEASAERFEELNRLLERLESLTIKRTRVTKTEELADELSASVTLPLQIRLRDRGTLQSELRFEFVRSAPRLPWRIAGVSSDHSSLIP